MLLFVGYNIFVKIEFIPSSSDTEILIPPPDPASCNLPNWYIKSKNFSKNNIKFDKNQIMIKELKQCMPFLDSISSGYMQRTWCDIYVSRDDENVYIQQAAGPDLFSSRAEKNMPTDDSYLDKEFTWISPWIPKTPKGYSCLYVNPLNRLDLPFHTASGIVDTDVFYHSPNGNIPFYLKKNFSGIIPAGTPMYQIIPFKRDNWTSGIVKYNDLAMKRNHFFILKNFWGVYKNNFWQKKKYR